MRIPGLAAYYETLAAEVIERNAWRRIYRERRREHTAPGPVIRYVPYGGIYKRLNESGSFMGYVDRGPDGEWMPAEVVPLVEARPNKS
jgi:hypothetical protein